MPHILRVSNVSVDFGEESTIKDVNFTLDAGENLAVIGPNGAGKTVLLRALLGLIPYRGKIEWMPGVSIGYVAQKIDADRHLPINFGNLLAAKAAVLKLKGKEIEIIVRTVGLTPEILGTSVGHLSGGQFQRALIAFALLGKPNVILFDEPTASIDKPGEEQIYELLHRLQDQFGLTVILVSHDLTFVYRYATKVLCINKVALCFGTPEEALTPAILEKIYGSHPKYFHHLDHHA